MADTMKGLKRSHMNGLVNASLIGQEVVWPVGVLKQGI